MMQLDAFRDIKGNFYRVGHEGSRRSEKSSNHAEWQLFLLSSGWCSWSMERWPLRVDGCAQTTSATNAAVDRLFAASSSAGTRCNGTTCW